MNNESGRPSMIGIPDKHKWPQRWKLASSRLATALGGFIICQHIFLFIFFSHHVCLQCHSFVNAFICHAVRKHNSHSVVEPQQSKHAHRYDREFLLKANIIIKQNNKEKSFKSMGGEDVTLYSCIGDFYLAADRRYNSSPVACVTFIRPVIFCSLRHGQMSWNGHEKSRIF